MSRAKIHFDPPAATANQRNILILRAFFKAPQKELRIMNSRIRTMNFTLLFHSCLPTRPDSWVGISRVNTPPCPILSAHLAERVGNHYCGCPILADVFVFCPPGWELTK